MTEEFNTPTGGEKGQDLSFWSYRNTTEKFDEDQDELDSPRKVALDESLYQNTPLEPVRLRPRRGLVPLQRAGFFTGKPIGDEKKRRFNNKPLPIIMADEDAITALENQMSGIGFGEENEERENVRIPIVPL